MEETQNLGYGDIPVPDNTPRWMSGTSLTGSRFSDAALPKIQAGVGRIGSMRAAVSAINQGVDIEEIKRTRNEMMDEMKSINRSLSEPIIPQNQRLNALQNQFADLAQTAPQAPQFQAPGQPSDLQSALSIIAQLAAPNRDRAGIALAPYQAADAIAQRQNQFNQNEFQVDQANFAQQVNNLQKQIQVEADQVRTLYGVEIDQRQILRQRLNDLMDSLGQNNAQLMLQQSRGVDDTRQQQVVNDNRLKAMQKALDDRFKAIGTVDEGYNQAFAGFVSEIMQMYGVDQATAAQMLSRIETGTKTATQSNEDRNFGLKQDDQALRRQQFDFKRTQDQLKLATTQWKTVLQGYRDKGVVTTDDVKKLETLRKQIAPQGTNPNLFPIPPVGKTWQMVNAETNASLRAMGLQLQGDALTMRQADMWMEPYQSMVEDAETLFEKANEERNKALAEMDAAKAAMTGLKVGTKDYDEAMRKSVAAQQVFRVMDAARNKRNDDLYAATQKYKAAYARVLNGENPNVPKPKDKTPKPKPIPGNLPSADGVDVNPKPLDPGPPPSDEKKRKTKQPKEKQGPPKPPGLKKGETQKSGDIVWKFR